jgi:cytochrome c peroxidase
MRAAASLLVVLAACVDPPARDAAAWQWQLPRGFPAPRVPADNPMSADKVELGRHLFFDTRLSINGTQACSSCHDPAVAFTDGIATPLGATGERGRHNAMSLVNVAYNSSSTWASHVLHLEDQALRPMLGTAPVELGLAGIEPEIAARLREDARYADLFPRAFPGASDPFTYAHVARALASFERTIISGASTFDRFVAGDDGALTDAERRGLALFESDRLGCANCHGGFNLASSYDHVGLEAARVQFFNTGLYNVDGRGAYPAGDRGLVETTGDPAHEGRFKAPTLRNVAVTAPYLHDGSAATLDDVIDSYARGGRLVADGPDAGDGATSPHKSIFITGFELSAGDRADLLAFLGALTDEELLADARFASPW